MSHLYSFIGDKEEVFKGYLVTFQYFKFTDGSVKSEDLKNE
jgi:hypothetical protein